MMKLSEIEKKIEKAEVELGKMREVRAEALGHSYVRCASSVLGKGCGRLTQIRNIVAYIQTHYHVSASGCCEGDYWKPGEGQFDCPKCGNRNRLYDRPEIEKLKRYFKNVENVYDEYQYSGIETPWRKKRW